LAEHGLQAKDIRLMRKKETGIVKLKSFDNSMIDSKAREFEN